MPGSRRSLAVLAAVLASILGGSGHLLKSWLGHRHYLAATLALSGVAGILEAGIISRNKHLTRRWQAEVTFVHVLTATAAHELTQKGTSNRQMLLLHQMAGVSQAGEHATPAEPVSSRCRQAAGHVLACCDGGQAGASAPAAHRQRRCAQAASHRGCFWTEGAVTVPIYIHLAEPTTTNTLHAPCRAVGLCTLLYFTELSMLADL